MFESWLSCLCFCKRELLWFQGLLTSRSSEITCNLTVNPVISLLYPEWVQTEKNTSWQTKLFVVSNPLLKLTNIKEAKAFGNSHIDINCEFSAFPEFEENDRQYNLTDGEISIRSKRNAFLLYSYPNSNKNCYILASYICSGWKLLKNWTLAVAPCVVKQKTFLQILWLSNLELFCH